MRSSDWSSDGCSSDLLEDADIAAAVEAIAEGGYYNAGQDCTAACRVYAHASIHDRLVAELEAAVRKIEVGDPAEPGTVLGPMITARQRDRVDGFVARAAADTPAEIVTGGTRPDLPGFYYSPTLIAGARPQDEIVQKEVFGPVVSVTRFDDDAQEIGR